jgi:hypothetical protein
MPELGVTATELGALDRDKDLDVGRVSNEVL